MAPFASIAGALSLIIVADARYLVGNRFQPPNNAVVAVEEELPPNPQIQEEEREQPPTRGEEQTSLIAMQFTDNPHSGRDRMEMILSGQAGLSGIMYGATSFANDGTEVYDSDSVYGEFCVFDSRLAKDDPSYYPTIKDVMSESTHCGEHKYTFPLNEVMDRIEISTTSDNNDDYEQVQVKSLPVSGMLFHQGHAGAGLVSNALAAFDSALVVSEHAAIHSALSACDVIRNRYHSDDCSSVKQTKLVRDVITLLSRTTDANAKHLFLKLESSSAAYLPTLRALYPDAKWTFSYRNAEETLSKSMQRKRNSTCMKARRNPSMALVEKSAENNLELEGLSHHEVCALHLSTLVEAAIREHDASGSGMLVSYDDIVSSSFIVDEVLPYLGLQVNDSQVQERIADILSTRSNTRNSRVGKDWEQESIEISEEVKTAVRMFMGDLMGDSSR